MLWHVHPHPPIDLSRQAILMGVVNVTPDSFSDGGHHPDAPAAIAHGISHWEAGATILDIGGESTRPGADPVPASEELRRVLPVIRGLRQAVPDAILSIDTMKAEVAREAIAAGAAIINDVTGLTGDPDMAGVASASGCGVVVMHMQGTPRTMQATPNYQDVVAEVAAFLHQRLIDLARLGIPPERVVLDPGIGFGKNLAHNLALLNALDRLAPPGRPLLLGVSRKSFIGGVLGSTSLADRAWPTVALTSFARELGVRVLRVHDVAPNFQALKMTEAILGG